MDAADPDAEGVEPPLEDLETAGVVAVGLAAMEVNDTGLGAGMTVEVGARPAAKKMVHDQ